LNVLGTLCDEKQLNLFRRVRLIVVIGVGIDTNAAVGTSAHVGAGAGVGAGGADIGR